MGARAYQGQAIEVSYDAERCVHFAECVRGLPAVFQWSDIARNPLQRLMREWKATAAVYADPELAAKLKGPFDDDLGAVLPPEVVTDDAGRPE